jgi:hypothetical protein
MACGTPASPEILPPMLVETIAPEVGNPWLAMFRREDNVVVQTQQRRSHGGLFLAPFQGANTHTLAPVVSLRSTTG